SLGSPSTSSEGPGGRAVIDPLRHLDGESPPHPESDENPLLRELSRGADDGIRTRDPHLGKVMLYQLSHVRDCVSKITSGPDGPDSQPR
ncbi:MAG: hypothetical protein RIR49_118, partial [Actinomycetota bacterium]